MRRMRTTTVPIAPRTAIARPTGSDGGSSTPVARRARSASVASPTISTSFPGRPVSQPSAESLSPSTRPEYQPMNELRVKMSAATHARPSPGVQKLACGARAPRVGSNVIGSQPEERLDLVPDRQADDHRDEEEEAEEDPEPAARQLLLAVVLDLRPAPRALADHRPLQRRRREPDRGGPGSTWCRGRHCSQRFFRLSRIS